MSETIESILFMPAKLEMNQLIEIEVFGAAPSQMTPGFVRFGARAGMPRPFSTDKSTAVALLDCFEEYQIDKWTGGDEVEYTVWIKQPMERMYVAASPKLAEAIGRCVLLVALDQPGVLKDVRGSKIR